MKKVLLVVVALASSVFVTACPPDTPVPGLTLTAPASAVQGDTITVASVSPCPSVVASGHVIVVSVKVAANDASWQVPVSVAPAPAAAGAWSTPVTLSAGSGSATVTATCFDLDPHGTADPADDTLVNVGNYDGRPIAVNPAV
jgi:hypothetical protein